MKFRLILMIPIALFIGNLAVAGPILDDCNKFLASYNEEVSSLDYKIIIVLVASLFIFIGSAISTIFNLVSPSGKTSLEQGRRKVFVMFKVSVAIISACIFISSGIQTMIAPLPGTDYKSVKLDLKNMIDDTLDNCRLYDQADNKISIEYLGFKTKMRGTFTSLLKGILVKESSIASSSLLDVDFSLHPVVYAGEKVLPEWITKPSVLCEKESYVCAVSSATGSDRKEALQIARFIGAAALQDQFIAGPVAQFENCNGEKCKEISGSTNYTGFKQKILSGITSLGIVKKDYTELSKNTDIKTRSNSDLIKVYTLIVMDKEDLKGMFEDLINYSFNSSSDEAKQVVASQKRLFNNALSKM
jgi:hypothetical protein